MKKLNFIIVLILAVVCFSSCSTYKYSSAGKARYTNFRSGKFVKQPKRAFENMASEVSPRERKINQVTSFAPPSNVAGVKVSGFGWLIWIGALLAMVLIILILFGASSAWLVSVGVALGIVILIVLAFVIALIILGFLIMAIVGAFFDGF